MSDFYLERVEQLPQVVAGEAQFFSQSKGCRTGDFALRGRRLDPGLDVFLRHEYLCNKSSLEKIAHERGKIKGMIPPGPVTKTHGCSGPITCHDSEMMVSKKSKIPSPVMGEG
jgi:hypothetical protein